MGDQEDRMPQDVGPARTGPPDASGATPLREPAGKERKAKAKFELGSFEQLIQYAYKQKGRKISLKAKQEKIVASNLKLSDDSHRALRDLAASDQSFAVPRQLLLLAREMHGTSNLRSQLRSFVRDLLLNHPLLSTPAMEAAISNRDEAPSLARVLEQISNAKRADFERGSIGKLKSGQFDKLKAQVCNCMALWLADMKGLKPGELVAAMYSGVWQGMVRKMPDDAAQFRILTEIQEPAPLALACQEFVRVAEESRMAALASGHEAATSRSQFEAMTQRIMELTQEVEDQAVARKLERGLLEAQLAEAKQAAQDEGTHLRHDFETLRTRVLRALKSDLTLLESGLEALRRPIPKTAVMEDAVERVTDSMRREIRHVQGEG